MNDIPVRKCIAVASVLLAATVILLFMRAAGYEIPFFTQAVGLIFAGFAPGSLLLRILKLHNLGMARTLLYAVGLSIAFLMAVGFVLNSLFPFIGVSRPLDPLPILCGVAAGTLVLCGLVYVRDRSFTPPPPHGRIQITPVKIALLLPPLLAVLGAQLVNVRDNNLLLMFLIGGLSLVPVIAVLTKRLPESLFPWVILSLALALLLHRTMITDRLWGADIVREFACYRTVALNGVWQASAPNLIPAYNTSLAVTVLPAMFANLTGIDGLWVFKFVFPLLLALVPVAMYEAARTRFPKRTAFLAVFLTISGYLFYTTCPGVAKQLIATVFLTLFLLTLVDRRLASPAREIMLAVFGLGVVTSHYSTAFMFAIMVVAAIVVKLVLGRRHRVLATAVPMALIVVVTAAWYLLLADGAVIKQFLGMGNTAVTAPAATPATGAPAGTESVRLISEGSTNLPGSLRALYLVTQGFMVVGAATGFLRWLLRRGPPGSDEYMTFAACFSGLLGLELVLPQFSLVISLDRIYPMALIVLAPFCITSVEMTVAVVSLLVKRSRRSLACLYGRLVRVRRESAFALGTAGVFLMVYLLANSGFLYEIAGRPLATSIALSRDSADFPGFGEGEVAGAEWLLQHAQPGRTNIYYDTMSYHIFDYVNNTLSDLTAPTAGQILYRRQDSAGIIDTDVPPGSCIYLRSSNLRTDTLALGWPAYQTMDVKRVAMDRLGPFTDVLAGSNVVYVNGDSEVLYTLAPQMVQRNVVQR